MQDLNDAILKQFEDSRKKVQYLVGKKIKITSNYNGQSYGSSRKSLKGTIQTISYVSVDSTLGIIISIKGYEYGCPALTVNEWELI